MLDALVASGVPRHYQEGMHSAVGTSSAEDIVSYERGIRGGYFALISDHVGQLLGRPPLPLRRVFEANAQLFR
jgi:NAD(P)H dehydrogenase (quinone)